MGSILKNKKTLKFNLMRLVRFSYFKACKVSVAASGVFLKLDNHMLDKKRSGEVPGSQHKCAQMFLRFVTKIILYIINKIAKKTNACIYIYIYIYRDIYVNFVPIH